VKNTRASISEIYSLNAYWFGLSFLWNGIHQLILPAVLLNFVDYQRKNTTLGLLTFAGLFVAAIVQPISGSISDRWRSSMGRRRPLIFLGTLSDFIFLTLLALSGGLVWVSVGYIGLQFTSNIAHGPAQGLLPDRVPPPQRGIASGVKNIMDMAGLVAAMLILGRILDPEAHHLVPAMIIISTVLVCGAAVTLIGVHEQPSSGLTKQESIMNGLDLDNPTRVYIYSYGWLMASRFIFLIGVYAIQGFVQYYIRDVMKAVNPVKLTADFLATIILALMVFALGGGWFGDRIGHKRMLYIASAFGAVGSLLLMGARTPLTLQIYGSVFGAGVGLFLTSNWALANLLAPSDEAGKYLGLSNLATAGAGALARLTGPIIDIMNHAVEGMFYGYTLLFVLGVITALFSVFLVQKVDDKKFIVESRFINPGDKIQ
jgi:MFS family permease